MICPHCEALIDDTSVACPHCGEVIERKYCPTCGQAIGKGSNKKGVSLFIGFVLIMLLLILIVDKTVDFQLPSKTATPTETARPDIRPGYDIITKNTISIGDASTEEWMIHVASSSDSDIVDAGLSAIEEAKDKGTNGEVSVYVYTGDNYAVDQSKWTANLIYIRPDMQTSDLIASGEKIGDNTYIRWNR